MVQPQSPGPASPQSIKMLSSLFKAVRDVQTTDQIIDLTLGYIHQQVSFEVVWSALYDPETGQLVLQGCRGLASLQALVGTRLGLTPGDLLEQALVRGRALGVADVRQEGRSGELGEICQRLGLASLVVYPLQWSSQSLGVVILASPRLGVSLSSEQRSWLAIAGDLAAQGLYVLTNRQQEDAEPGYQPLLALLSRLGDRANGDDQLEAVLDATQQFIHPTQTRILWLDSQANYFWQWQPRSQASQTQGFTITVAQMGALYGDLQYQSLIRLEKSSGSVTAGVSHSLLLQLQVQALMVAPIRHQGNLVGLIWVENHRSHRWRSTDQSWLKAMADVLGCLQTAVPAPKPELPLAQAQLADWPFLLADLYGEGQGDPVDQMDQLEPAILILTKSYPTARNKGMVMPSERAKRARAVERTRFV